MGREKPLTYWKVRLRHVDIYTGNGYCRSETVGTVFIQKASDAKRVYATVVHTGNNADGNKEQGETNWGVQKVHNKHLSLGCNGTVYGGFFCVCVWKKWQLIYPPPPKKRKTLRKRQFIALIFISWWGKMVTAGGAWGKNDGHWEEDVWCGSSRKQVDACFKHLSVMCPHWVPQIHKLHSPLPRAQRHLE